MTFTLPPVLLTSPDATRALAQHIGAVLRTGDTLLLQGSIGAGKSYFARALIQSLQDEPEDVPSPTFTLVQTYDTSAGEVWHADLYRLSDPNEAAELGLSDAFSTAICLIEWPDRLGSIAPIGAVTLTFTHETDENSRSLALHGGNDDLSARLALAMQQQDQPQ